MLNSNRAPVGGILCVFAFTLLAAACGNDSPTAPTPATAPAPEPEPVTLTGTWSGAFAGALVAGDGQAQLTQDGTSVTGDWSAPMPAALVALGAPANIDLAGPVTGTVTGTTAELSFGFLAAFATYFGNADCALAVSVTSFTETTMEATWRTNDSCQAPAVDQGTLTFMR